MSKRKKKKPIVPLYYDRVLKKQQVSAKLQLRKTLSEEEIKRGVRSGKFDILFSIVGEIQSKQIHFIPRQNLPLDFLKDMLKKALASVDEEFNKVSKEKEFKENETGLVKKKKLIKAQPLSTIKMDHSELVEKSSEEEKIIKKNEIRIIKPKIDKNKTEVRVSLSKRK